jgi:inhibitor of KinA
MQLMSLGDQACLAQLPDEASALGYAAAVRAMKPIWLIDIVPAYSAVAIFFDLGKVNYAAVAEQLGRVSWSKADVASLGDLKSIPCCYDMARDLERVSAHTGLAAEEIIRVHSGAEYTVYAMGFCAGFPYLGYLPQQLCSVPRLSSPRPRVEIGSVGLTGNQTGIYTQSRPGGWNLIGRTPLELVNVEAGYFPLAVGDRVRFEPIGRREFKQLQGKRL